MYEPPPDPRYRSTSEHPTWRRILGGYAVIAAVPLVLWAVENPLAGAVVLAAVVGASAGLFLAARTTLRLVHCLDRCRECTLDLPGTVQITVTTCE